MSRSFLGPGRLLMGVERIGRIAAELMKHGMPGKMPGRNGPVGDNGASTDDYGNPGDD